VVSSLERPNFSCFQTATCPCPPTCDEMIFLWIHLHLFNLPPDGIISRLLSKRSSMQMCPSRLMQSQTRTPSAGALEPSPTQYWKSWLSMDVEAGRFLPFVRPRCRVRRQFVSQSIGAYPKESHDPICGGPGLSACMPILHLALRARIG
jgi:hypothetical protein